MRMQQRAAAEAGDVGSAETVAHFAAGQDSSSPGSVATPPAGTRVMYAPDGGRVHLLSECFHLGGSSCGRAEEGER